MNVRVLILSLAVAISSCASVEDDRQRFKRSQNYKIDHNINVNGDTPYKIEATSDPGIKNYHYKDSAGCKWMVTVELQTIKSWKYVSAPDLCVLEVNWGGPW